MTCSSTIAAPCRRASSMATGSARSACGEPSRGTITVSNISSPPCPGSSGVLGSRTAVTDPSSLGKPPERVVPANADDIVVDDVGWERSGERRMAHHLNPDLEELGDLLG